MATKYQSGTRIEHIARKYLEDHGYTVVRSAGSKGAFDLVAIDNQTIRLIQCKYESSKTSYSKDSKNISEYRVPACATKELWVYRKQHGFVVVVMFGDYNSELPIPEQAAVKTLYMINEKLSVKSS